MNGREKLSILLVFASLMLTGCGTSPGFRLKSESVVQPPAKEAGAASPNESEPESVHSLGLPSRYEFYLAPMLSYDRSGEESHVGGLVAGTLHRHLFNPNYGLGLSGEGYLGGIDGEMDSGVRFFGTFRMLFLQLGLDYSFRHDRGDFICSFIHPIRRGGLFGRGGGLRFDWIPGRDHSFSIGYSFPLGGSHHGRTRPEDDHVTLPEPAAPSAKMKAFHGIPELESALQRIRHAADWMNRYVTPFFDQDLSPGEDELEAFREKVLSFRKHLHLTDELHPEGHTFEAETTVYHRSLNEAVALSLDPERGRDPNTAEVERVAHVIRQLLFKEVLIPYDRLLGLNKRNDSLMGFGENARESFKDWLGLQDALSAPQMERLMYVFDSLLRIMEENRQGSREVWEDSKLVWMPLQYGLRPDEVDTHEEMDAILEALTEEEFTEENDIHYVINEQYQPEVARMVRSAEDYHVLWIHDYRGLTPEGDADAIAFELTLEGYFAAMIDRARKYDETGKFPIYLIIIDQFYYEENEGRVWLQLLERPLDHVPELPPGHDGWKRQVLEAQELLRTAVNGSSRLQKEKERFGDDWIRKKIKVHVNITNRADFSFRSRYLIDDFPFSPDNLMRDHRKISFFDVTELDPGKGEAILGGLGIGEHYAGPNWEDRAMLVRGPALLSLKDAAREVLLQQGLNDSQIPKPLRSLTKPPDYEERLQGLRAGGWEAKVLGVHNQTGFRPKRITALKATLYSLMPAGSTIIVPDSLWNSSFWGGMLVGAALRGCRVLVIAPALENAPSAGFPQMSRAHELFSRMLIIKDALGSELAAAGGMLKVGIYSKSSDVGDMKTTLKEFEEGFFKHPFLAEIFPFRQEVFDAIEEFELQLEKQGFQPTHYTLHEEQGKPKLHMKTNFLASQALSRLVGRDGWEEVFRSYLNYRAKLLVTEYGDVDLEKTPAGLRSAIREVMGSFWQSLSDEEQHHFLYYLTIGSQNQDFRGKIMDGEVDLVVSGYRSIFALIDLFFMSGFVNWVEDAEGLDELLPPESGWKRRFGRFIMKAL